MSLTDKLLIAVIVLLATQISMRAYADHKRRRAPEPLTPDGKYDASPAMVANITGVTWVTIISLSVGMIAGIIAKGIWKELPDYVPMILPALTMMVGQIMGERKAIIAYLYDGSPPINEQNAANAAMVRNMHRPDSQPPDATATARTPDGTTLSVSTGDKP